MSSDTEGLITDSQPNGIVDGDWICAEAELVFWVDYFFFFYSFY